MRRKTDDGRGETAEAVEASGLCLKPEEIPALRLRGVEVRHGEQVALAVPELAVAAGEALTVAGPNGAGKSTLLQVAALLRRPDSGEVWIAGERVTRRRALALRRRIAMVFQDPLLFDRDVLANATSGLRFRGVGRREAERTAAAWLDRFGVAHLAARAARDLSGGEAQRVSLARAFAVAPELLLLDEPFAALDAPTRAALVPELAARLRDTRTAAVIVTHDLSEAVTLGDRLAVVLAGRIAQFGPPDAVLDRPASGAVATFLGVENVLPARVVATAPDRAVVALAPTGPRLAVALPPGQTVAPGATGRVVVRASQVRVGLPAAGYPAGWTVLAGTVADLVWTPAGQRLDVRVAPDPAPPIRAVAERPIAVGQPVTLGIAPDAAHVILDEPAG